LQTHLKAAQDNPRQNKFINDPRTAKRQIRVSKTGHTAKQTCK
jgi:hypothetical protein